MKNYEQYKRMVRFSACMILFLIEMIMFYFVWCKIYNRMMEVPYYRLGNWMMFGVYGLVLTVFSYLYGGWNIGSSRVFNLIYSHFLISLFSNTVMYVIATLLIKAFRTVIPMTILTAVELLVIMLWSSAATRIYCHIYPPRKVLLIYGDRPALSLMNKIRTGTDRFEIGRAIHVSSGIDQLQKEVEQYDGVVLGDIPSEIRNKILKYCYSRSIRTYTIPKISDILLKSAESLHTFDTPLLLSRNTGLNFEQQLIKRIMDIIVSAVILIISSPALIITALLIKQYDGGPVFFTQDRCTKDGKVFKIYKFRSMIVNAEESGIIPAIDRDPRITPIGRVIRKLRIDEFPQLINILKGEMSLVGPRPERIEHVQKYSIDIPEFEFRMKVKGGLTGYAQVYGKYNTTAYDKLKMDLMYIENYSILLDIEILFKTVKILFMKESTEGFSEEYSRELHDECGTYRGD